MQQKLPFAQQTYTDVGVCALPQWSVSAQRLLRQRVESPQQPPTATVSGGAAGVVPPPPHATVSAAATAAVQIRAFISTPPAGARPLPVAARGAVGACGHHIS